jgi:SAM-dependent methyltransferase
MPTDPPSHREAADGPVPKPTRSDPPPSAMAPDLAWMAADIARLRTVMKSLVRGPEYRHRLARIRSMSESQEGAPDADGIETEERAWPYEARFVASNYHEMMLGRYCFAGSLFSRGADVLDTCSGLGWGAYLVAEHARSVVAVDCDAGSVQMCRAQWNEVKIDWLVDDVRTMASLEGRVFDVVLSMEAIEHLDLPDGERYVANMARLLRPTGVLIGTSYFPEHATEAREAEKRNLYHPHIYTQAEIRDLLLTHFERVNIIGEWMFIATR